MEPDIPSYLRRRCALARLAIDLPQRPPPGVNQNQGMALERFAKSGTNIESFAEGLCASVHRSGG